MLRVSATPIIALALIVASTHAVLAATSGKAIFEANCATCHGSEATGIPDAVPPLARNPFVSGEPKAVIRTVLGGRTGPIVVKGKKYDSVMPAWQKKLSSAEIAAVVSYIRTSFGNKAAPVTEREVAALKR